MKPLWFLPTGAQMLLEGLGFSEVFSFLLPGKNNNEKIISSNKEIQLVFFWK